MKDLQEIHNYSLNQINFITIKNVFIEQYKMFEICYSVDCIYIYVCVCVCVCLCVCVD